MIKRSRTNLIYAHMFKRIRQPSHMCAGDAARRSPWNLIYISTKNHLVWILRKNQISSCWTINSKLICLYSLPVSRDLSCASNRNDVNQLVCLMVIITVSMLCKLLYVSGEISVPVRAIWFVRLTKTVFIFFLLVFWRCILRCLIYIFYLFIKENSNVDLGVLLRGYNVIWNNIIW